MKTFIRNLTWLLALVIFLMPVLPHSAATFAQTGDTLATLDPVLGLVQYQTAQDDPGDLASWQTLSGPILVGEGDRIRTGNDGLAYLTYFEGAETEIGESTLVVVSTLALPESSGEAFNISLDVLVGSTFNSVEVILDVEDRFEIHTPGASVVVRGTRWWTIVTPDGESAFATERGEVQIIRHIPPAPEATPSPTDEAPAGDTTEEPATGAVPSAADTGLLVDGAGLLTDRNGEVLNYEENITLPERRDRASIQVSLVAPDCGDAICERRERVTCPVDCLDQVQFPACGDGMCDTNAGEDLLVCGTDCGPWSGESCGNGMCDPDESGLTCPQDCAPGQYFSPFRPDDCGNGTCDVLETALNCPQDCTLRREESPRDQCGNGACDSEENNARCPADCPAAPITPEPEPGDRCGNGICGPSENAQTCPADCPTPPTEPPAPPPTEPPPTEPPNRCGDGTCSGDENALTCPLDCPIIQPTLPPILPVCGDGKCDLLETFLTCPADCKRP